MFGDSYVKSGRLDLNQRPLRPERSALSKLSYAPSLLRTTFDYTLPGKGVNAW